MKKLLLLLLIAPVLGFGQVVLDVKMIEEKYNGTVIGGYFDRYGELLFDGAAAEHNISEFKTIMILMKFGHMMKRCLREDWKIKYGKH